MAHPLSANDLAIARLRADIRKEKPQRERRTPAKSILKRCARCPVECLMTPNGKLCERCKWTAKSQASQSTMHRRFAAMIDRVLGSV